MKACNSPFGVIPVKRCKHMRIHHQCNCTKNCAMCSVGGTVTDKKGIVTRKVDIWMHPALHDEYVKAAKVRNND